MSLLKNSLFATKSPQRTEGRNFLYRGEVIPYIIKRSRRKSLSVRIDPSGEIVACAPLLLPVFSIESFLNEKAELILKHRDKAVEARKVEKQARIHYKEGESLSFKGDLFTLRFISLEGFGPKVSLNGKFLDISGKLPLSSDAVKIALEKWFKREAKKFFNERVIVCVAASEKIGIDQIPQISVRNMKSRWGSCRIDRNKISLNLKLIQLDVRYIDSVIYHELCHFLVGPHNSKFYSLLEKVNPLWKEDRKYLKENYYSINALFN